MARAIASQPGETLDALCWRALGSSGAVEAVYAANPGLAALGPVLPAGTAVTLPDSLAAALSANPPVPLRETIQLWN